ncbi:hypothetical protein FAUST_6980 [Fusarium austroamericanum]|uniref:DUF985 domain-containing protein n=1 Tax=Fusarium austroamericanum TaxID=282268 RepID=A0AAN5Z7E8_FUSAU|nr:hypothetical protein FAUST_6980 [Fusarium austroamericanum]
MSTEQTANEIITLLGLTPHPEGGYFFKSFQDPQSHIGRAHSTCIYYLVIGNGGPTRWHRINDACEVWHHYAGAPLKISVAWDDETGVRSKILGKELARGQRPQAVVEKAQWQRAESLGEWTLVGCHVAPGFVLEGFELAEDGWQPRATAIPHIAREFNSLDQIGWYGSSYFLTLCSFQLLFGRIYGLLNPKWLFLLTLGIFEIGSLVCALAQSSISFIAGSTPLEKRPIYISIIGSMFGIASISGPLIGGALSDKLSWRVCFWLNLPLGGSFVSAIIVLCLVRLPSPSPCRFGHVVKPSEIMGLILILSGLFCAVLFLQWGGTTHAWNSWQIILLMVIFVITMAAFGGLQTWQGEEATKVKGATALQSGIQCIPLILCNVVGSLSSGLLTTKLGHYFPSLYLSMVLTCIGAGLFVTLRPVTETAPVVGYQVLYGFGSGLGFQLPQIAAQTVLKETEVQIGIAMTLFFQSLGGTLFLSVGNSVFKEQLRNRLLEHAGLSAQQLKVILSAGAVAIESTLQPEELEAVRSGYSEALIYAYYTALAASILSAFGGLFVEWKSVTEKVPSSS